MPMYKEDMNAFMGSLTLATVGNSVQVASQVSGC
jgi:hypothetical protein